MNTSKLVPALATLAVLSLATGDAAAQAAGSWLAKLGINHMQPDVSSGDLSAPSLPGSKVDMKAATSLIATLTWFYTDNLSVEAYGGLSYKHDIVGDGSLAGAGTLGTIRQVSPTVFGQWRFGNAGASVRPYVGLGLTYAYFFDETGSAALTALTAPGSGRATTLSTDAAWGWSPQVGVSVKLGERWRLDAGAVKTFVKTSSHLSTGQSIEHRLDPLSLNVSLAYRF
jgi:outer membrane protein